MFVTAFFLCFIVKFCSFIPGSHGNIRRKSKRDVRCDVQRTSLPLQVTSVPMQVKVYIESIETRTELGL